jgi:hypothetical protein
MNNSGFTCAACFRRTGRARFRGRVETAASASYAKRGKKLLNILAPARCTGGTFFSSDRNKSFKVISTLFADEFVNGHDNSILNHLNAENNQNREKFSGYET